MIDTEIINAELPPQNTIFTQWFYADCLMQYYEVETYSEKHWQIIENFMTNARKYGQSMILTPVLSPELDTYVGGYRPSTQLVEITLENIQGQWVRNADGSYPHVEMEFDGEGAIQ